MEKSFKLKITVSIESKTDETYSSWREEFTKTNDETLVLTSETATRDSLQKAIKDNMSDVLQKAQNFVEVSKLLAPKEEDLTSF